jgi:hypothetical protein
VSSVWINGPRPPGDSVWCTACAMLAKGLINEEHKAEGEKIVTDGKSNANPRWISPVRWLPLQPAVVRGLWDMMPQLGILDLCWTHVAGASWEHVSTLAVPPGLAPKGRG